MPLKKQLVLLQEFGLTFHEAMTEDLVYRSLHQPEQTWRFDDPAFDLILERLYFLNYQFNERNGTWISPRTFLLHLDSYDAPETFSSFAERLSEMAGSRNELRILDESVKFEDNGFVANGIFEFKFQKKRFSHKFRVNSFWLDRISILKTALIISSLEDGFQFYGFNPTSENGNSLNFLYMLESERDRIRSYLNLLPWKDYFEGEFSRVAHDQAEQSL